MTINPNDNTQTQPSPRDDAFEMESTMREIEDRELPLSPKGNKREEILSDISSLEHEIKAAEDEIQESNDLQPSNRSVSPELANERKRHIVFLNKDLRNKQTEYEELDS